jgi:hypothetical protein
MIKNTLRALAAVSTLLAATAAHAQMEGYRPLQSLYILNYEMSGPIGSFSDNYINNWSFRGMSFEGRSMVREKFSVGLGVNFNRYDQTYDMLVQSSPGGGTISGPVYRYADQFAIKALFHAYLMDKGRFLPYVGVGIGGVWTYAYGQTSNIALSDNGFDFIVSPEVGLALNLSQGASRAGLNLAFRYNYTTASFAKVNDLQSLTGALGLYFAY